MKQIFYDFECFMYDWLVVFIDYDTRERTVVINDIESLTKFYNAHVTDIFCGYNSRVYDQVMFKGIMGGKNAWDLNTKLIAQGLKEYQAIGKLKYTPFNNYDCLLLNKSLKQLEGFLNVEIRESSVDFNITRKLTEEEIEETVFYCTHDVENTIRVFDNTKEEFDAKMGLIEMFDLPISSIGKTKAQLAAQILEAEYYTSNANDEFDIVLPNTLKLSEKYQYIADWYLNPKNHNYSRRLNVDVAGCPHTYAFGGVHGAIPNFTAEGIILGCDVALTQWRN